ncbi:MAG: hypothetical protein LBM04_13225 [Opitutaceae bacterium]|nr:hypothetical protein [Opitutaceae bacterium]
MKLSLSWLNDYVDLAGITTAELSRAITFLGFEVESVHDTGAPRLNNVVTGRILTRAKHPNADKLSICTVDVGPAGGVKTIVCGAPNCDPGNIVPVALPGAILPGDFEIKQSKIRGQTSDGMMCSSKELALEDGDHAGLMILASTSTPPAPSDLSDPSTPSDQSAQSSSSAPSPAAPPPALRPPPSALRPPSSALCPPSSVLRPLSSALCPPSSAPSAPPLGTPLNDILPPGDTVFDIEITHNRPDCLSHLGIARELSAWFKKAEGLKGGQRTEDRRQRAEDRGQRTEGGGQRTEDGGQRTEDRGQRTAGGGRRAMCVCFSVTL